MDEMSSELPELGPEVGDEQPAPEAAPTLEEAPSFEPTGHIGVDEVLAALEGLDEMPVDEQVSALETAHDALRAALADAGNESG